MSHPDAARIRHDAVKADTLRVLDGLTDGMKTLFGRLYPHGLDGLADDALASAHALVVRSAEKLEHAP